MALPSVSAYCPARQKIQALAPVAPCRATKRPRGHGLQCSVTSDSDVVDVKWPGAHDRQYNQAGVVMGMGYTQGETGLVDDEVYRTEREKILRK